MSELPKGARVSYQQLDCPPEITYPTRWSVRVKFVPRDLWIGAYWTGWSRAFMGARETLGGVYAKQGGFRRLTEQHTYICLLPCLPIIVTRKRHTDVPYYSK